MMSKLLDQLDDENMDFSVVVTDSDGVTAKYEFLDVVSVDYAEYAVLCALDSDGYVDIFRIDDDGSNEIYVRQTDEKIIEKAFEMFRIKNEDEFDFE